MSSLLEMDQRQQEHSAAHAAFLRAIAAVAVSGDWKPSGARNLASFLVARYDVSWPTARQWVTEAESIAGLPALAEAYAGANVSVDQARSIAKLSESDDDAQVWLETLEQWPLDDLQREARKVTARKLERDDGGRYVRMGWTTDERFMTIDGRLHPDEGAVVMQAIERAIPDQVSGARLGAWYADGLVGIARRSLSSDADQERATVVIHVDQTTRGRRRPLTRRADGTDADPVVGELERGGLVPLDTVERCTCDARFEYVEHDHTGREIGIGRAGRNIPPWLYRQLRHRDRQCVFPGCTASRFLRGHHIVWWSRGGQTTLSNLILVCDHHHTLVHEHQWDLRGPAGPQITWIQPDGRPYQPRKATGTHGYDTS